MTWKTLRDALGNAAACGFDFDGDGGAATPSVSRKGTPTEAGAEFQEVRLLPAKEGHTDRCMTIAIPNELPRSAVVIHLRVIEGGLATGGEEKTGRQTFRRNPGGSRGQNCVEAGSFSRPVEYGRFDALQKLLTRLG